MQIVVNALLSRIKEHNPELNEAQLLTRKYGLEVFLSELSKFVTYLLIFSLISLTWYFLLSMLIYCTIRIVSGGYHAGSFWGCFVISFIGFAIPVISGQYVQLDWVEKFILIIVSLVITLVFAPVIHKNTPKRNLSNAGKFKILSIVLVTLWGGLAFLLPGAWSVTAVFTIFMEGIMQLIGKRFNPVIK